MTARQGAKQLAEKPPFGNCKVSGNAASLAASPFRAGSADEAHVAAARWLLELSGEPRPRQAVAGRQEGVVQQVDERRRQPGCQ